MPAPHFDQGVEPKKQDTCEGSAAIFTARITGDVNAKVVWYCDDEVVEDDKRRSYERDEEGNLKITIHSAEPDDQGVWKCVASNADGEVESVAVLGVEFDPTVKHE